ncbi:MULTISPECIES: FAD-binding oxidoreductase [Actinoalloteichus]|uniref:FAD/FMN-dependent dehydrogenase n=1 Tax=Actinoalloteichus fjordicus TaxID=1612552 RepID=A0AAC9PSN5_9PSEU|nr:MULTISPECIES: FAD-dependent oxidoreductase [Actinoalloteichus]APU15739.1 FAD/FMN-dependent dehydrogenase [Actinoalloteichus fjordicus]APU21799.1 FAD/FMN-dependent dehydrogenase [Actinoalloteichus sp. GBA129-24]
MESDQISALASAVAGEVVVQGDDAYEELRNVFAHQGSPEVIVRCTGADDVRAAIGFARAHELPISVRSGGHSNAGFSTDHGGLVIDLSPVDEVRLLDSQRNVVRLGSGARWGRVAKVLGEHGLVISAGDTSTVGVGGLLLGGGIGWLVRRFGLALDNVVAAEVVTAAGHVLRASATENPELFYGIRGGGGNFGVVISFDVLAQESAGVHFGTISYPAEEAADVVTGWAAYLRTAADELTATVGVFPPFDGVPPPVTITVCYAGSDTTEARKAIAPLCELGTVQSTDVRPMPYAEVLGEPSRLPAGWQPMVRSAFAPVADRAFVETVLNGARQFPMLYVEFRSMGGAVRRVAEGTTAFAHRDEDVMFFTTHLGGPADHDAIRPEFDEFWRTLAPFSTGAYSGFLSEVTEDDVAAIYPSATRARLAALKAVHDPENAFRRNPNVRPSA